MQSILTDLPYDSRNAGSIVDYAKKLVGKSFKNACLDSALKNIKNKGNLGQYLEECYFLYNVNSDTNPDFKEAGIELKTTPLKIVKGQLVSKERLVLNLINYLDIVNETWPQCSFLYKNSRLLIVFYLHNWDKIDQLDFQIKMVELWDYWKLPEEDRIIIKQDWEKITRKIKTGKAHEISEGDTFYLGACTKGIDKNSFREQPFSTALAKQRAFCLKQSYVNRLIKKYTDSEPLIKTFDDFKEYGSIEKIAIGKLSKYIGKDVDEIYSLVGQGLNRNAKSFYANLAARMLGVRKNKIEEFEKGDITVKTIRLKYSGMPKEDMSFPYFDYNEIIKEEWESSSFLELLEKRYFFMIYQYDNNGLLHFINGMFWNMPYEDIEEAKKVWEETVKRIKEGRAEDLPRKSENDYCHVRPHARDSNDTCDTPYGNPVVKKCFWLNAKYLKGQIEKNLE